MPSALLWGLVAVGIFASVLWLAFGVIVPGLVRRGWGRWHVAFPAVAPDPGGVARRNQSFSVGLLNLGYGVHVVADASHLHLTPGALCRGFGLRPVSIPWDAVGILGAFPFGRLRAKIGGVRVIGPAWCLGMARGQDS